MIPDFRAGIMQIDIDRTKLKESNELAILNELQTIFAEL